MLRQFITLEPPAYMTPQCVPQCFLEDIDRKSIVCCVASSLTLDYILEQQMPVLNLSFSLFQLDVFAPQWTALFLVGTIEQT